MAKEKFKEAQGRYNCALPIVGNWGSKDWTGILIQNYLDLDFCFMEGPAESLTRQGKSQNALV